MDVEFLVTDYCSKCGGYKTWNTWYHSDETLCDDCYYWGGIYHDLTPEQAKRVQSKIDTLINEGIHDWVNKQNTLEMATRLFTNGTEVHVFNENITKPLGWLFANGYRDRVVVNMTVGLDGTLWVKFKEELR